MKSFSIKTKEKLLEHKRRKKHLLLHVHLEIIILHVKWEQLKSFVSRTLKRWERIIKTRRELEQTRKWHFEIIQINSNRYFIWASCLSDCLMKLKLRSNLKLSCQFSVISLIFLRLFFSIIINWAYFSLTHFNRFSINALKAFKFNSTFSKQIFQCSNKFSWILKRPLKQAIINRFYQHQNQFNYHQLFIYKHPQISKKTSKSK